MAHIEVNIEEFQELLGRDLSEEEMDELSFLGAHWNHVEGKKWDVEVYPDRPDLLSVEGLARAYRAFFGVEAGIIGYSVRDADIELEVEDSVGEVRPFIGGAVVRGVELDRRAINGLIQLQEKLHETMGRGRRKLAIGLHDLADLEPPFTYRAVEPERVSFTPLEGSRDMHLGEILEEHEKGREYSWILEDHDRYPVIQDSDGAVLSFPPIINNQLTEVEEGSEDIFIDVTGNDLDAVRDALAIVATALAERGGELEAVEVDGDRMPDLKPEIWELDQDYFRSVSGLELSGDEIAEALEMMGMEARPREHEVEVEVPAHRTDAMHQYDLIEDAVIANRYSSIEPELPELDQSGGQKPLTEFRDLLRDIMVGAGLMEAHTFVLSSREKLVDRMGLEGQAITEMENPLTEDYSAARNRLLPALVEVLASNRHHGNPQRFFEAAEVVELDGEKAENRLKLACVVADSSAGYTDAREVLQVLERDLGVDFEVEESERGSFREDRCAKISLEGEILGSIGELAPEVLANWGIEETGAAGFEIDAERLMELSG